MLAMFAGAQVVHQYYLPDLVRGPLFCLFRKSGMPERNVISDRMFFFCQSIPEIPPKPGELRTELRGYRAREDAAAAASSQLGAEQKVD